MTIAATAAKAAVKKNVKKKAVESAKHRLEKPESENKKAAAKVLNKTGAVTKKVAKTGTRNYKRVVSNATKTYSVRSAHNLLMAMWITGTLILIAAFMQDDTLEPFKKWKKLLAFQFTMLILSVAVLVKSIAKPVSYLSVVIVLGVAFNHKNEIAAQFSAFTNGLTPPPLGERNAQDIGVAKGVQKQVPVNYSTTPVIPREPSINNVPNRLYNA